MPTPVYTELFPPEDGKLAHNIAHFARALRKAGLPIGPGRTLDAVFPVRLEIGGQRRRRGEGEERRGENESVESHAGRSCHLPAVCVRPCA